MKRKASLSCTIAIIVLYLLAGAAYGADIHLHTDSITGLVHEGSVWLRYGTLVALMLLSIFGIRFIAPQALSLLRTPHKVLAILCFLASLAGLAQGVTFLFNVINFTSQKGISTLISTEWVTLVYQAIQSALFVWYGIWMLFVMVHFWQAKKASPTKSAPTAIFAALPFAVQTIHHILVNPASIYRFAPQIKAFASLIAVLWFGFLLRAFYIAMVRSRVRQLYLFGLYMFLFCTCLLPIQTVLQIKSTGILPAWNDLTEYLTLFTLGLLAIGLSLSISNTKEIKIQQIKPPPSHREDSPIFSRDTTDDSSQNIYRNSNT